MAAYLNNFEAETLGQLPAGWTAYSSPSGGTVGNALVSASSPIFGKRSLVFASSADGMAERYTAYSGANVGIVFAQRIRIGSSGGQAGALVGTDGNTGFFCYLDAAANRLAMLYTPSYGGVNSASGVLSRAAVDNDLVAIRAEFLAQQGGTVRAKIWFVGDPEPAGWQVVNAYSSNNGFATATNATAGLRISGGGSGVDIATDTLSVYDPTTYNAPVAECSAVGNSTANLFAFLPSGGSAAYTYQWSRGPQGGTLATISGATSLFLADTGLAAGTAYDYVLAATDTGSGNAVATSPRVTATTAGTSAPSATVSGVTVAPTTASVPGGATKQYAATVAGTNGPSQGVTWTTNLGTVNASGLFTGPPPANAAQTATITATSTADATKSGTATATIPAASPPTIGTITNAPSGGFDNITYPAPTAASRPVAGTMLFSGTTAGGEGMTAVATNQGAGGGTFTNPSNGLFYYVRAYDSAGLASAPSNEVQGATASGGTLTAVDLNKISTTVNNVVSTYFPPGFLAALQSATTKTLSGTITADVVSLNGNAPSVAQLVIDETTGSSGATTALAAVLAPAVAGAIVIPTAAAIASQTAPLVVNGLSANSGGSATLTPATLKAAFDGMVVMPAARGESPTLLQKIVWLYRRFAGKAVADGQKLNCYADDGTTILSQQSLTFTGVTETQGPLS